MLMCAFRRKLITIDNTSILLCVQCVYMGSLVLINYRMCLRIAVCRLIVVVGRRWRASPFGSGEGGYIVRGAGR